MAQTGIIGLGSTWKTFFTSGFASRGWLFESVINLLKFSIRVGSNKGLSKLGFTGYALQGIYGE
jgi:hypothetical protein